MAAARLPVHRVAAAGRGVVAHRQLHRRADDFRFSLNSLLSRKGALINRFINTLVQEVRNTYQDLHQHINQWLQEALLPLAQGNQYQKDLLEAHMLRLTQLQKPGGKRLPVGDFLRGFPLAPGARFALPEA